MLVPSLHSLSVHPQRLGQSVELADNWSLCFITFNNVNILLKESDYYLRTIWILQDVNQNVDPLVLETSSLKGFHFIQELISWL